MQTTTTHKYTQSVDEIAAAFLDEGFLTAKFETLGSRNIDITVTAYDDDTFKVVTKREAAADVPRALKSVVKPWNAIVQTESWSGTDGGPYHADIEITTEGVPATINTTIDITAAGDGCECVTNNEITCSIPLVGKQLAKFIAKESLKVLEEEYGFISESA
ncbi:MAG: DUF2505 domain-containing protein [Maricaulaceae bacterium]